MAWALLAGALAAFVAVFVFAVVAICERLENIADAINTHRIEMRNAARVPKNFVAKTSRKEAA